MASDAGATEGRWPWRRCLLIAVALGTISAAARWMLPEVRTRDQLTAFIAVAVLFEMFGHRKSSWRTHAGSLALNAGAITLALIATKIALEGRPHYPKWMVETAAAISIEL